MNTDYAWAAGLFGIVFPFVKKRDMIDSFGCAVAFSVVLLLGSVMWHIKPWDSFASKTVERSCE